MKAYVAIFLVASLVVAAYSEDQINLAPAEFTQLPGAEYASIGNEESERSKRQFFGGYGGGMSQKLSWNKWLQLQYNEMINDS